MSIAPAAEVASNRATPPWLLIAQTSQEIIDATLLQEMERLEKGGRHPHPLSDFLTFVLVAMVVCFAVIFIGRRLMT